MAFELPELPYAYDALGEFMSAETLEYHHDKHHKAYVDNGNKLAEAAGMSGNSLEEVVMASFGTNAGLFNNAAQHYNHMHFWHWMAPNGGGKSIPGNLEAAINSDLGGYDKFKADFMAAGATQFGSGWCWIAPDRRVVSVARLHAGVGQHVQGANCRGIHDPHDRRVPFHGERGLGNGDRPWIGHRGRGAGVDPYLREGRRTRYPRVYRRGPGPDVPPIAGGAVRTVDRRRRPVDC